MPTTIKLKNSVTTTSVPSSLVQGEVAINITDKKVWVGNAATTPIQLLGGGADGNFTNISVSSVATFGAGTVSAPSITTTGDTNTGIYFPAADTIAFTEGGVEAMRIDSSGNVGLKTTPSAWNTFTASLQIEGASLSGLGANNTALGSNAYYNSAWKYYGTGSATLYQQNAGQHAWSVAGSGTAGNNITFTQAMTLDASGNVGIGTSSPLGTTSNRTVLTVNGVSSSLINLGINNSETFRLASDGSAIYVQGKTNIPMQFYTNDTEKMRITSGGDLLIGTTTAPYSLSSTTGNIAANGSHTSASGNLGNLANGTNTTIFTAVAGANYLVTVNAANTCSVFLVTCENSSSAVTCTSLLTQNGITITNSGTTIRVSNNYGGQINTVTWSSLRLL